MDTWKLSRVMGCSLQVIDLHYGHLAQDHEQAVRELLNRRTGS